MAISTFPAVNGAGGGLQPYEQVFTTSGVWAKPDGVKTVDVTLVGAGSKGGSNTAAGGPGGVVRRTVSVDSVTEVPITIGAAAPNNNSMGGNSSFGSFLTALGGPEMGTQANVAGECRGVVDYSSFGIDLKASPEYFGTTRTTIIGAPTLGVIAGNNVKIAMAGTLALNSGNAPYDWRVIEGSATGQLTPRAAIGKLGQRPVWNDSKIFFDGTSNTTTQSCYFPYDASGVGTRVDFNKPRAGFWGAIGDTLYLAPQENVANVSVSTDNGSTWSTANITMTGSRTTFSANAAYNGCYSNGSIIVGATPFGVFATSDGLNWVSADMSWSSSQISHHVARYSETSYAVFQWQVGTLTVRLLEIPLDASSITYVTGFTISTLSTNEWNSFPGISNTGVFANEYGSATNWRVRYKPYESAVEVYGGSSLASNMLALAEPFRSYQQITPAFDYETGYTLTADVLGSTTWRWVLAKNYAAFGKTKQASIGAASNAAASGNGAGGPVLLSAAVSGVFFYLPGPGVEGFARGFEPLAETYNPGGGTNSAFPANDGIAVVRWWA